MYIIVILAPLVLLHRPNDESIGSTGFPAHRMFALMAFITKVEPSNNLSEMLNF